MRKTYKPLARVEKASQMYKRKTLNVNDELNIRHDEDDIENVDEYWSTAMSVIGNSTIDSMDEEKKGEASDTLFNINNIRKSIQGGKRKSTAEFVEDLYKTSVNDGRAVITEERDITEIGEEESNKSEEDVTNEEEDVTNEEEDVTNEEESNKNEETQSSPKKIPGRKAIIKKVYTQEDEEGLVELLSSNSEVEERKDIRNSVTAESIHSYDGFEMEAGISTDDLSISDNEGETIENRENIKEKEEEDMALKSFNAAARRKTKPKAETNIERVEPGKKGAEDKKRTKVEAHNPKKKKNYSFVVETPVIGQCVNVVVPIVCSTSLDVAMMTLDFMAYVEDYKTENAFSIYVIKGKIELTVNGSMKTAMKGSVSVVEKDGVCTINCISKDGAILLLAYALSN